MGSCSGSTVALNNDKQQEKEKKLKNGNGVVASGSGGRVEKSVVSGVFHQQRLLNLMELGNGNIENVPTLAIAIDYWHLPKYFTLRDIVVVVRIDEAHHRNVNYFASDSHFQDNS
ncbi:Ubiquinol oxidase 1, mitochondrial [Capsicum chinense]|nr:Ubiquinol oxidase 1, mitochondrial [Capsicum chinense]